MKNKYIGNLLIAISVIIGFVFLIFGISASILAGKSILLSIQIILGLLIFLGIAILGNSIRKRKERKFTNLPQIEVIKFDTPESLNSNITIEEKIKNANNKELRKEDVTEDIKLIEEEKQSYLKSKKTITKKSTTIKVLNNEEKKVIRLLKKAEENEMMQADLIKKAKVTKVKMTRILKKLETKNIISKKKIGMTNIIVLR